MKAIRIALPMIGVAWFFLLAKDTQSFLASLAGFAVVFASYMILKWVHNLATAKQRAEYDEICRLFENAKGSPPRPPPPTPQRPQ